MPLALDLYTYAAVAPRSDRRLRVVRRTSEKQSILTWTRFVPEKRGIGADTSAVSLECWNPRDTGCVATWQSPERTAVGIRSEFVGGFGGVHCVGAPTPSSKSIARRSRLCQKAEYLYPETMCGIMDQFISCHGRAGHALMLDCRSLDFQLLPIPTSVRLMVCNTMVTHQHARGGYNERRRECEEGLRALREVLPGIQALRDVTLDELNRHRNRLKSSHL